MQRLYKKNKGAITLLISVIILTLLGIVTLYTVKVNVMDQRMVASEADYQEAFTMAEAGLDFAVQRLSTDVFNNLTSNEHLEYSITKRKTDGSPAIETEAGFAVKIGCKRGDADEIVPCSHDDILRSQSTYIKDGGLDGDYAPTEIPGAPIYDIKSTGYSTNGSSEVTVRRQMTMKPLLNGVSSVSLIVDGDIHTGDGSYHIGPSYSGDEPLAIWASGEVIMRNHSNICVVTNEGLDPTQRLNSCHGGYKRYLRDYFGINFDFKLTGGAAADDLNLPDRVCNYWNIGTYAESGIRESRDITNFRTLWGRDCIDIDIGMGMGMGQDVLAFIIDTHRDDHSSLEEKDRLNDLYHSLDNNQYASLDDFVTAARLSLEHGDHGHENAEEHGDDGHENAEMGYKIAINNIRNSGDDDGVRVITIEQTAMPSKVHNVVIDESSIHKTRKYKPDGTNVPRDIGKQLENDDTLLRSYDTSNTLYRAILPYARDFAAQPFPEDLFEYTFGVPRTDWETIKDKAEKRGQLRANCNDLIANSGDQYILWWITGNCNLNVDQAIGTQDKPVVLVIEDARLQMLADSRIYGRIFLFNKSGNTAKPSARFRAGTAYIYGGLTSDVDDIEIGEKLYINSYDINRYEAPIGGDSPQPALAEFNRRNYDLIDVLGSWYDY